MTMITLVEQVKLVPGTSSAVVVTCDLLVMERSDTWRSGAGLVASGGGGLVVVSGGLTTT